MPDRYRYHLHASVSAMKTARSSLHIMYNRARDAAGFVTWVTVGPHFRLYHPAAFPRRFLSISFPVYPYLIADSGYESEEITKLRRTGGMMLTSKPSDHEQRKNAVSKKDIGKFRIWTMMRKMMLFIATITVSLTCVGKDRNNSTGFKIRKSHYVCIGCSTVPIRKDAFMAIAARRTVGKRTKQLER